MILAALMGAISVCPGQTAAISISGGQKRAFAHPSIMSTQTDLSALKNRVSRNPISKLGYEQLKKSRFANPERPHTPFEVVVVVASGTSAEENAYRDDAQAAHACALMWVITGENRYRDKAIAILNDWAKTFKELKSSRAQKGAQIQLEAAWNAPIWTAAADIIRYYDKGKAGWKPEQIAKFDQFLNIQVGIASKAQNRPGNWGASANLAIMAAAVYQDDHVAFDKAVALHRKLLAQTSKPDGSLSADYLRDPWHPQYTIEVWQQICEIAWNQGVDLYGITVENEKQPRLAICLEHFSKLFVGKLPNPKDLQKGNYLNSHKNRQAYELGYNHYIVRKGMTSSMPTFAAMVPEWRPGGIDSHFIAWDTLTHGGLDNK